MEVRCTQCGAALEVAADARLVECEFCSTALVVEGEGALFHEVMLPTVTASAAEAHLRRFLAGGETAGGLDREAEVSPPSLQYFPFWAFTVAVDGGERVALQPAAPSSLQGLQGLALPAGASSSAARAATGGATLEPPEVALAVARDWLERRFPAARVVRTALFHVPLHRFSYRYRGRVYTAAVEAVSGAVLPADFPAKAETPYRLVAALALVVFGLEGLLIANPFLKLAAYLVSAVPVLGVAWLVCRRV